MGEVIMYGKAGIWRYREATDYPQTSPSLLTALVAPRTK